MLTEAEAKEKWCPYKFAVPALIYGPSGERAEIETASYLCRGTACMAWRAVHREFNHQHGAWLKHGYCGAFGPPKDES